MTIPASQLVDITPRVISGGLSGLAFVAAALVGAFVSVGVSGFFAPIQSIPTYMLCPYDMSVAAAILCRFGIAYCFIRKCKFYRQNKHCLTLHVERLCRCHGNAPCRRSRLCGLPGRHSRGHSLRPLPWQAVHEAEGRRGLRFHLAEQWLRLFSGEPELAGRAVRRQAL